VGADLRGQSIDALSERWRYRRVFSIGLARSGRRRASHSGDVNGAWLLYDQTPPRWRCTHFTLRLQLGGFGL
jgi:hypothetical protein